MTFFTIEDFLDKYRGCQTPQEWQIEQACEMTYTEIGLRYRDPSWNSDNVPIPIKKASMEHLRFMLEYDIPTIDYKGRNFAKATNERNKCEKNTEVEYSPPHIAICGKQLRKFGETLWKKRTRKHCCFLVLFA